MGLQLSRTVRQVFNAVQGQDFLTGPSGRSGEVFSAPVKRSSGDWLAGDGTDAVDRSRTAESPLPDFALTRLHLNPAW